MQVKRKKLGQVEVSMKSLEGLTSRWGFKKNYNGSKCYRTIEEKVHSGEVRDSPRHGDKQPMAPRRGARVKISRYDYNQEKNQDSNSKSQGVLLKARKASQ